MKTIKLFLVIIMITAISDFLIAQTTTGTSGKQKTETFKVWGNCDMCKTRIEKAVRESGAESADWNIESKLLTVSFDPSKTSVDSFGKKLALVGHDTEKYAASDKAYNALDDCCKYDRTSPALTAAYSCPMHSDVHSDKPGKCPKCGMALVKK